ncbi:protein toll-like [Ylistrum balloti]|uniref:protein toll-like n=1 Tax=Ylistrum balloti TaxID=509963 RepID=UPI002905AEB4|nr:protein toll-like [Ylistrum balloti]
MSKTHLCLSSVLLLAMIHVSSLRRLHDRLPRQWFNICKVRSKLSCLDHGTDSHVVDVIRKEKLTCLVCDVHPDNIWNFHDFRRFTERSGRDFAISVRCHDEGNITLPFPIRAAGLRYISVTNCLILDYMSEYFDSAINAIPDTLVYSSIKNSVILVDIMKLIAMSTNMTDLTRAAKCGPEKNIIVSIAKNISYTFGELPESILDDVFDKFFSSTTSKFMWGLLTSSHTCFYSKLIEMDLSVSRTRGAKFDSILINNAHYPALESLKVSDSLLSSIPDKFNYWRMDFPRLMNLDLSHNHIEGFDGVLDYGNLSIDSRIGTLDLQHNHISFITLHELESLLHHRFVKVDIRNNPFNCDCKMRDFIDYFRRPNNLIQGGNAEQYDYLRRLKCQEPLFLKGRTIVDLNHSDIGC